MISEDLRAIVEIRYRIGKINEAERLTGGYWNDVFRIETDAGFFVLRVCHHRTKSQNVEYQHALTKFLSHSLPEIAAPIATTNGATFFFHGNRIIYLLPFFAGERTSRKSDAHRAGSAKILARLHRAALAFRAEINAPTFESIADFDWQNNSRWNWAQGNQLLEKGASALIKLSHQKTEEMISACREIIARKTQIAEERQIFQNWFAGLKSSKRQFITAPTHGDFYPGNVLFEGNRLTAVIDWDEAHADWLIYELSRAIWEFCRASELHATLNKTAAQDFLQNYLQAEGVVSPTDFDLVIDFIRCVRLQEVLFSLAEAMRGEFWDAEYTLFNLRSLENLRGFTLDF